MRTGSVRCLGVPAVRRLAQHMPDPSPTLKNAGPKRKKRRRLLLWLLAIPLVLILTVAVLAATGSLTRFIVPVIEKQTGLEMTQGTINLSPAMDIEMSDAVFRAPDIDGAAGEILRFDRATISMRWGSILAGSKAISGVMIENPTLRVSQDTQTKLVNLQSLNLQQSGGGGAATPAITINNGLIELGEHTGTDYTELKQLSVVGNLAKPDASDVAKFNFLATSTLPTMSAGDPIARGDFMIAGEISKDGIAGEMTGLSLEDWPPSIVPSGIRETYEALALSGRLAPTEFAIDTQGRTKVMLRLDGVDVSLPFIPPAEFAGPEKYLRMRSTIGTIEFTNGSMIADLKGDIDDLLYDVNLDFEEYALDSPFTCELKTSFRIEEGFRPLKFLPQRVTEKLDRFQDLKADIAAEVDLVRGKSIDGNSPILVSGRAVVSNGSARYNEFVYPFTNIQGAISFTPDSVLIEDITGNGPTGAKLLANGEFEGLGEDSVVKIVIDVTKLPIDQHLLSSMDDDQRDLVQTLFSRKQYNNLLDSGYLLTDERRAELVNERDTLVQQIARLPMDQDQSSTQRDQLSRDLAQINAQLRVPEFDFGGMIGVAVTLRRHPEKPEDDRWTTDINALIPNAGIVPKQFPLPIVARDVSIEIKDGSVFLQGGQYEGLSGGLAYVQARFEPREGFDDPQPYVEIQAENIPIDERLIAAIPGYYDEQPSDPKEITLRRILDRLRMQGIVQAQAVIGPGNDGRIIYEVEADVLKGSAHPLNMGLQLADQTLHSSITANTSELGLDSVQIGDMVGVIYVTESIIVVDLNGLVESPSQPITPTRVQMTTQLTLPRQPKFGNVKRTDGLLPFEAGPPAPGPELYINVDADGLDLAMPLEHAIAVLSPSFASKVSQWRNMYSPDGVLDVQAQLSGRAGGSINSNLQIDQINQIGFSFENHRYQLGSSIGPIGLDFGVHPKIESRGFSIPISIDDSEMGELALAGSMRLARGGQLIELNNEPSLRVSMQNGRLGSPGVRTIVNRMGSSGEEGTRNFFDYYGLDGAFDLLIDLTPIDGSRFSQAAPGSLGFPSVEIDGSMIPKTLTLQRDGELLEFWNESLEYSLNIKPDSQPMMLPGEIHLPDTDPKQIAINELSGSIRFDGLDGYFDNIVARNKDYALAVDGQWSITPGNGASVNMGISATGQVLNGPMRIILPDTLNQVVDQLEVSAQQDIELTKLHIVADQLGSANTTYNIDGSARVLGANALIGLPVTQFDGSVDFQVSTGLLDPVTNEPQLSYQLDVEGSRLRAGLFRVHNARATVVNVPDQPGVLLVPEITAGMHGGVVTGNAQVRLDDDGNPWYATELQSSGVRAAPIFDDLFLPPEGLSGPPKAGSSRVRSAWNVDSDVSRGVLQADLALSGPIGSPDERFGRGYVRVNGGSIVALPGLINLIEASNLKLPTGSRLDLAESEFYIDGPTVSFERLSASSKVIEILGYGTMDWTSRDIDLRFRSRSVQPIPVLSNLLEGIRDELITIRVAGTPGNIAYLPEQFGTTKRLLDSMFGTPETQQQRRLREVESRTRVGSGRLRGSRDDQAIEPTSSTNSPSDEGASANATNAIEEINE